MDQKLKIVVKYLSLQIDPKMFQHPKQLGFLDLEKLGKNHGGIFEKQFKRLCCCFCFIFLKLKKEPTWFGFSLI